MIRRPDRKIPRILFFPNVFASFIVSYVAVLLVPLFCSLVILFNMRQSLESELVETNNAILTQTRQTVETVIDNATSLCLDLSAKDSISSILYITPPFTPQEQYNIGYAIRNDMKNGNIIRQLIEHYLLYFNNGDFLLTPSAKYDPLLGFNEIFKDSSLSFEDWQKITQKLHFMDILDIGNYLMYCQTLPYIGSEPAACIMVLIDKQNLLNQVNSIEWVHKGRFFLVDGSGSVILTNSSAEYYTDTLEPSIKQNRSSDNILFSSQTADNGWTYILEMDNAYLHSSLRGFNNMFVYYVIAAVSMGIWMAVLFARRNYKPIKNVVTALKENQSLPEGGNEFAFINSSVRKIINLNADMQHQLRLKNEQVRQNYLSRLLRGRISISDMKKSPLTEDYLKFEYGNFLLAVFRIDKYMDYFSDMNIPEDYPLDSMDYSLIYLIRELICQKYTGYVCEVSGYIACVINFSDEEKKEDVMNTIRYTQNFVAKGLYISVTAAVSSVHKSQMGIQRAYEEATTAMENSIFNKSDLLFYTPDASTSEYGYSSDLEKALTNSLCSGSFGDAKGVLDEVFGAYQTGKNISGDLFRCFAYDIAATFIRALENLNLQSDTVCASDISSRIAGFDSADKIHAYFILTAEKICDLVNQGKESHNTVLLNNIYAYLHQNFSDVNLSNTLIAEAMDISPAYLSRFFKQQTGEGILSYINRIRIEEAKKRMASGKYGTLSRICSEIGFENTATFIRIFKKQEGITPGKYIEIRTADEKKL